MSERRKVIATAILVLVFLTVVVAVSYWISQLPGGAG